MAHKRPDYSHDAQPAAGDSAVAMSPPDASLESASGDERMDDSADMTDSPDDLAIEADLDDLLDVGLDIALEVEQADAQREAEARQLRAAITADLGDDDDALFEVMAEDMHAPAASADSPDDFDPITYDIRLVAIDIDGTLLTSDKKLPKRTLSAIAAVRERGVRVVLASARPPRTTREIYRHLKLDTLQVNYNGAVIYDPLTEQAIFHKPIEHDVARRVIDLARQIDPHVVVNVENQDRWYTDRYDPTMTSETGRTHKPDVIAPIEDWLTEPITKLMLAAPPQRLQFVLQGVRELFDDEVSILISDHHLIQMVHPLIDKAYALRRVAEQYRIDREHVMVIGDAPNDIGMLQWAGLGVAMGNAWDAARLAADVIAPTNDENGVVHALKEYILKY